MHTVYIALGSNKGKREKNIRLAIDFLLPHIKDMSYSRVYKTLPLGDTLGKHFLNMVVSGSTEKSPKELLTLCKDGERKLERKKKIDDIERTIDIDVIFYDDLVLETQELIIPHPRYHERDFVLRPLCDISPTFRCPKHQQEIKVLQAMHTTILSSFHYQSRMTHLVGILNVTPDSFSDGRVRTKNNLHNRIKKLIEMGADTIDVGAESTAPGSIAITQEQEKKRLEDIFSLIQENNYGVQFSLDTVKASIAKLGVEAGIDIINDVSGGRYDSNMFTTIANLGVPYILMYCKNPSGRADLEDTKHENIVMHIIGFLEQQIEKALTAGVKREQLIIDPGMGAFISNKPGDSIQVLQQLDKIKNYFNLPLFVCTSRKGFHSKLTIDKGPTDRLGSSLASSRFAVQQGVDYIRVHDLKEMRQFIDTYRQLDI